MNNSQSKSHSTSIDGPLFKQASDVVCTWLRIQLNSFFQRTATLDDFFDFILHQNNERIQDQITRLDNPDFIVLQRLANFYGETFGFFCQLFPEMSSLDICFRVLENFLALPTE